MKIRWAGFALCLGLIGCGGGDPAPVSTNAVEPQARKQTVIGIVSPALSSTFHVTFVRGAVDEGVRLGWKVDSLAADRETNFAAQVNLVESLVRRKVDAISICAINDKAIVGAVEKANEAGIPIFIHNALTDLPGGKVEAYIGYNQRKAGQLCGDYAMGLLTKKFGEPKGSVFVVEGIPGFHSNERTAGFLLALEGNPNVKLAGRTPANWERQEAMNVGGAALKANPEIDLFFGCSDAMAQGAAQAAAEAGKQVYSIGIDGNPDTLKDIQQGVMTASCAVYPEEMGRITIRSIADFLAGKPVERKIETPIAIIDSASLAQDLKAH
jgi:ribose transport system substrate-binding protein